VSETPDKFIVQGKVLPEKTYDKLAEITELDIKSATNKASDKVKTLIEAETV
jgi:hypothetical protein